MAAIPTMSMSSDAAPQAEPTPCWSQWYHATPEHIANETNLAPLLKKAAALFGACTDLRIDCQSAHINAGTVPGIPTWQSCAWAGDGAVILVLAEEALLEIRHKDAAAIWPLRGQPITVTQHDLIRFHPATCSQEVGVALIRRRVAADPKPLPRHSARVFQDDGTQPPLPIARDSRWATAPKLIFRSQPKITHWFPATTWAEIAAEPSQHAGPIDIIRKRGGVLVQRFIDALPDDWKDPQADVSIGVQRNELDVGWSPCLVGWHMDGTSRAHRRADGRPNLADPGHTVDQQLACFGTGAPTRYLQGLVEVLDPPLECDHTEAHALWQETFTRGLAEGRYQEWLMPADSMVAFGFGDFHTGSRARVSGWRCMIKAMRGRGGEIAREQPRRNVVAWPKQADSWPSDPCGIFPDVHPA